MRGLLGFVMLLCLSGCHLISNPDQAALELQETPTGQPSMTPTQCSVAPLARGEQSLFTAWWEGQWELDSAALSQQLAMDLEHNPEFIGESLASAFSLNVRAQQAELKTDGRTLRLATTPLPNQRGARLVGAQREVFIWCEGEQVYWRVESGERFQLRRTIQTP